MPPIKRRKTDSDFNTDNQNKGDILELTDSNQDLLSLNTTYQSNRLTFLPDYVLLYLFDFLTPVDLLTMMQLGDQRLSDLTLYSKIANFSLCAKASYELIESFFCKDRLQRIQKLNFNFSIYMKPSALLQIICQCKNLEVLSVVGCGLTYNHISSILKKCLHLKELTWNTHNFCDYNQGERHPKLKKLYVIFDNWASLMRLTFFSSNAEDVFINYASDSLITYPFIGSWLKLTCISTRDNKQRCTIVNNNYTKERVACLVEHIQNEFLNTGKKEELVASHVYNCPPYLCFRSTEEDLLLLSSCPRHSYSTLTILVMSDIYKVYGSLLDCIIRLSGHKLNQLTLDWEADLAFPQSDYVVSPMICEMLNTLFLTCANITVLNIGTVHFTLASPFKAICLLKNLNTLCIPTCVFMKSSDIKAWESNHGYEFKEVVKNCAHVEKFHLTFCTDEVGKITDMDIHPVKDWGNLKYLSIFSLNFRSCNFLRKVADFCKEFQSFSLISQFPENGSIYYDDVIYLLKTAKNLTFLRINDRKFNPVYERFWDAVGEAENLEGICILTSCNSYINNRVIIKNVQNLKYLHMFHFEAPRLAGSSFYVAIKLAIILHLLKCYYYVSKCVYNYSDPQKSKVCKPTAWQREIWKSMQHHGIANFAIERDCHCPVLREQTKSLHYHRMPEFRCRHVHLQNISI